MSETQTSSPNSAPSRELNRGGYHGLNAVILIFIVAIGLRFTGITFDSMWLDEGYQTMVDAIGVKPEALEQLRPEPFIYSLGEPRSVETVLANFRQVDPLCPPLYFLMLNRWMTVFGTTDLPIRALSALTSIASLAILYFGTRKLLGPKVAFFALLMQAVSPFDITYAQEARMYALVMLTSSLSGLSYFQFINAAQKSQSWTTKIGYMLLYSVSTWALINTHYTGLYVVAFQGLFGTAYSIKHKDFKLFLHLSVGWALVCLFWLPWFQLFSHSASKRGNFYVTRDANVFWAFKGFLKIVLNWISFMAGGRIVAYVAPIYATSVGLLVACGVSLASSRVRNRIEKALSFGSKKQNSELSTKPDETQLTESNETQSKNSMQSIATTASTKSTMIYIWCWALAPALIALTSDIAESRKTIEVTRYLMGTAPAVFILAGFGAKYLMEKGGRFRWIVVAHVLFALGNYTYAHIIEQREPWRQMAGLIEEKIPTTELLLISPHYDLICLNRYLTKPRMQVGTGPLLGNQQVYALVEGRNKFWLLTAQDGGSVTVFIPPEYKQTETIKMSHGLLLTSWELPSK
ncbi:MAG: glycosyltransferase family 39 protein [Candidatus Melainabacteria bacterium]|nr:glycosyltransferase family 39 protein [Candidatus Melainabacteria bacterium]